MFTRKIGEAMQVSETPKRIEELELLKLLQDYSTGSQSYLDRNLGDEAKEACKILYAHLLQFTKSISVLLDKVHSREMDMFTMHDSRHSRKVAHLMWNILTQEQQEKLTPPEIGLMVTCAFFHDFGMLLLPDERDKLLKPESELWRKSNVDETIQAYIKECQSLIEKVQSDTSSSSWKEIAKSDLQQKKEAILCGYVRENHATTKRYTELFEIIGRKHTGNKDSILDIKSCLFFDGFSFQSKMVQICVSHNEPEASLLSHDTNQPDRLKFSRDYPVGSCSADLLMVACALRLADILDFDRERTPEEIYRYFLSCKIDISSSKSALEWEKHLAIANWHINQHEIIYKARCANYIVHHAIILFCKNIEKTILRTKKICDFSESGFWPFTLPEKVTPEIHADGYRYLPLKFSIADERIYNLLIGRAIYTNSLSAVRELVQNAVDACKLRDSLTKSKNPTVSPNIKNRITIKYVEPNDQQLHPILKVTDNGTGMDESILTNHFLRAGSSYYKSDEFSKVRAELCKAGVDFAPVSEFGVGFLSCFLLGDQIQVETAFWDHSRGDTNHRLLDINGPSRLIQLKEKVSSSVGGTSISIELLKGSLVNPISPPSYYEVIEYLRKVCFNLPYELTILHVSSKGEQSREFVTPKELVVEIPSNFTECALRIPINDGNTGITGEIVLYNPIDVEKLQEKSAGELAVIPLSISEANTPFSQFLISQSDLIRGGFKVGSVPGLPDCYLRAGFVSSAVVSLGWKLQSNRRYLTTNLSRDAILEENHVRVTIEKLWISWLVNNVSEINAGFTQHLILTNRRGQNNDLWMEEYSAFLIYQLARNGWSYYLEECIKDDSDLLIDDWEAGSGDFFSLGGLNSYLYRILLDYILPRISTLSLQEGQLCVSPPISGWREVLKNCNDFITNPVTWGQYIEYGGEYKHLLLFAEYDSFHLNIKYKERIEGLFNMDETHKLIKGLKSMAEASQRRQVGLSPDIINIIQRAQEGFGELEIGTFHQTWRVNSFILHN